MLLYYLLTADLLRKKKKKGGGRYVAGIARNSLEDPQECRIGKHFAQRLQRVLQSN